MRTLLITGSNGFMGRNLCVALRRQKDFQVLEFDLPQSDADLRQLLSRADMVFHLAGINRPKEEGEFMTGNAGLTQSLCASLLALGRNTPIVLSSSIQAELDNPYGRSKKAAEDAVLDYHQRTGAPVYIYRFPNVFGKWSRPNYNTVVATFCHNISRGLPVQISNRGNVVRFVYIDDIVREFLDLASRFPLPASSISACQPVSLSAFQDPSSPPTSALRPLPSGPRPPPTSALRPLPSGPRPSPAPYLAVEPEFSITLGELHDLLVSFRDGREKSVVPNLADPLTKCLYSTYISFCDPANLAYPVDLKTDDRGWLFELVKSPHAGQIFVSRTRPGITRGNHYHDTKIEKFCVIQGEGVIRFRHVLSGAQSAKRKAQSAAASDLCPPTSDLCPPPSALCPLPGLIEYRVTARHLQIVDIPPGYTHSIENTGREDMITLFWASEIFDPQRPDTHPASVLG